MISRSIWALGTLLAFVHAVSVLGATSDSKVFVARRGWHIDIGLAATDLSVPLKSIGTDLPQAAYVFLGFGDKHYLLAAHRRAPLLLAALWPGEGMILATGVGWPIAAFGTGQVISLVLSADQMRALQAFIWSSLRTQGDSVAIFRAGPYPESLYFESSKKYSAIHTCNTWVAEALRAAGFDIHSGGVVFAGQLWSRVHRLSDRAAAPHPDKRQ